MKEKSNDIEDVQLCNACQCKINICKQEKEKKIKEQEREKNIKKLKIISKKLYEVEEIDAHMYNSIALLKD